MKETMMCVHQTNRKIVNGFNPNTWTFGVMNKLRQCYMEGKFLKIATQVKVAGQGKKSCKIIGTMINLCSKHKLYHN
jgi:hypothetical protein